MRTSLTDLRKPTDIRVLAVSHIDAAQSNSADPGFVMRLIIFLLFLLFAPSALARMDPGPPPWLCRPVAACDGNNICVSVYGPPMGFNLRAIENQKNKFILEGLYGNERLAAVFSSREEARLFVETDSSAERATIILIPNNKVADARSFWAHSMGAHGTGERFLSPEHLLIACGSIPQR
jgi:hypothetical protein